MMSMFVLMSIFILACVFIFYVWFILMSICMMMSVFILMFIYYDSWFFRFCKVVFLVPAVGSKHIPHKGPVVYSRQLQLQFVWLGLLSNPHSLLHVSAKHKNMLNFQCVGAISHSSQCSSTGVAKPVVCVILSVGWCI